MKKIIIPMILLFSLMSIPGLAQYPLDINISSTSVINQLRGFACSNVTGTFYCYLIGGNPSNDILIERYNETWQDRQWCDTGLSGPSSITGGGIANSTGLIWKQTDGTFRFIPTWNIDISSSCGGIGAGPQFGSHSTGVNLNGCGYYDINSNSQSGWCYWGLDDDVRNSTSTVFAMSRFWDPNYHTLHFPDQRDNTTLWAEYDQAMVRYTNGVGSGSFGTIGNFYGVAVSYNWDLWKIDESTTWIYYVTDRFYRANFTVFEQSGGGSVISTQTPKGNVSVLDNPPQLVAQILPSLNGSVEWFLDGISLGTANITSSTTPYNIYFTPSEELALGLHYWQVNFTDDNGFVWASALAWFTSGSPGVADFLTNPLVSFASVTGALFGVADLSIAQDIFGLLASLIISVIGSMGIASRIKGLHGNTVLGMFFGIFIVSILVFAIGGFLSAWVVLAIFGIFGLITYLSLKGG